MKISEVIGSLTGFAPLSLQESWDNSGVQVGAPGNECSGVMVCVDCTPAVLTEAHEKGCNLVVAHHPLLFRGVKQVVEGGSKVQDSIVYAIRNNITVFALHTPLDSCTGGISRTMAAMLDADTLHPITAPGADDTGLGVIAEFDRPITTDEFVTRIKKAFGAPVVRVSLARPGSIKRIGICGGSGGEFIPATISEHCDAYLSSDIRYHDFVDYGDSILICDIGHFESEECAKQIFYHQISEFFPNFAVYKSESERNSIKYL